VEGVLRTQQPWLKSPNELSNHCFYGKIQAGLAMHPLSLAVFALLTELRCYLQVAAEFLYSEGQKLKCAGHQKKLEQTGISLRLLE
jgi:hypothetical protein